MPNRKIEPQGKAISSATPRSSASRDSGAEACTLVPPSNFTISAMVLWAGRTLTPLRSDGTTIFFLPCSVPGLSLIHI